MIDISILILTHNAPRYVEETLRTLHEVTNDNDLSRCEIIVLDNSSEEETKSLLRKLESGGYVDKLKFSPENTFFARGNNLAAEMADKSTKYYLLLNSDVSIRHSDWLSKLIEYKEQGDYTAVSYGVCGGPNRADGYCLLIDRNVYDKHKLDEDFQWWGGVTKLQCELLKEGHSILAIDHHDDLIYHFGGKSGRTFKQAQRVNIDPSEVMECFRNSKGKVVVINHTKPTYMTMVRRKIKKVTTLIRRI